MAVRRPRPCDAVHPFADPDPLVDLEHKVLARPDPPLHLEGMPVTPIREQFTLLRRRLPGSVI